LGALVVILSLNDALIPNQPGAAEAPPGTPAEPVDRPDNDASGGAEFPEEAVYAGKDATGKVAVAVAIKDDRAVAYVCDGKSFEAWLTGVVDGGRVTLESNRGPTIDARFNGKRVTGVAADGDVQYAFDLEKADPPAGLYREQSSDTTIGWIVLPDGSQVGIKNTNGTLMPAPRLDPETADAELVSGGTR
jgi:hypothetical protein